MKKSALLMVLIITSTMIFAQRNNRTTAFNYLRNGELDKAKEYIDKTIDHPQTREDARTWFYRGNIYLSIAMSEEPSYKALADNALEVAVESYVKAKEYDTRKQYYTDIITNLFVISEQFYNDGVESYNEGGYLGAMYAFEQSLEVTKLMGSIDTMAMFNVALTAEVAGEYDVARKYYMNLREMKYESPDIYASLGRISLAEGDTITALKHLTAGREIYPEDFNLLINEINIYLLSGEIEKAVDQLELAVEKDATNPTIFFAVGVAYDQLKSQRPEQADEYFKKAVKAYQAAIDLDPDYFDPVYNLGALYVNEAAVLIDEANKLPLEKEKEYNALIEKATEDLRKSLPNLERALEINPNDFNTMVSLKEIYTRLNKYDKLQDIDRLIKEYQERD
jgi:tetratricopeptide (TPR) repeat protein